MKMNSNLQMDHSDSNQEFQQQQMQLQMMQQLYGQNDSALSQTITNDEVAEMDEQEGARQANENIQEMQHAQFLSLGQAENFGSFARQDEGQDQGQVQAQQYFDLQQEQDGSGEYQTEPVQGAGQPDQHKYFEKYNQDIVANPFMTQQQQVHSEEQYDHLQHQVQFTKVKDSMKSQNTTLKKMLKTQKEPESENIYIGLRNRDSSSQARRKQSRSRSPYQVPQKDILTSEEIMKQKIETPLQYKMAVKAQKMSSQIERKRIQEQNKHIQRISQTRFGSNKREGSYGKYSSASKIQEGALNSNKSQVIIRNGGLCKRMSSQNSGKSASQIRKIQKNKVPKASKKHMTQGMVNLQNMNSSNQFYHQTAGANKSSSFTNLTTSEVQPTQSTLFDNRCSQSVRNMNNQYASINPYGQTLQNDPHLRILYAPESQQLQNQHQKPQSQQLMRRVDHNGECTYVENSSNQDCLSPQELSGYVNTTQNHSIEVQNGACEAHYGSQQVHQNYNTQQIVGQSNFMQNMQNQYNFEINPNNQYIFEERQRSNFDSGTTTTNKTGLISESASLTAPSQKRTAPARRKASKTFQNTMTNSDLKTAKATSTSKQHLIGTKQLSKINSLSHVARGRKAQAGRAQSKSKKTSGQGDNYSDVRKQSRSPLSNGSKKQNSITRSLRTFMGLSAGDADARSMAGRADKNNVQSASQKSKMYSMVQTCSRSASRTRSKSRKSRISESGQNLYKSPSKKIKQQDNMKADQFYYGLVVRKHFCIWIEKFIDQLKKQRLAAGEQTGSATIQNESDKQIVRKYQAQSAKKSLSRSYSRSRSRKSMVSDNSTKKSGFSRQKSGKKRTKNFTATNEQQILFKDASKSSVPISQGFFDNIVSPNSNSLLFQPAQSKKRTPANRQKEGGIVFLTSSQNTLNDNVAPHRENNIRLKKQIEECNNNQLNIASMKNIEQCQQKQQQQQANCFKGSNQCKHTRNVSSISCNGEFKETAQLGCQDGYLQKQPSEELNNETHSVNIFQRDPETIKGRSLSNVSGNPTKQRSSTRMKKALQIMKKFDSKRLDNYLENAQPAILRSSKITTSLSKSSKSRSQTRSRSGTLQKSANGTKSINRSVSDNRSAGRSAGRSKSRSQSRSQSNTAVRRRERHPKISSTLPSHSHTISNQLGQKSYQQNSVKSLIDFKNSRSSRTIKINSITSKGGCSDSRSQISQKDYLKLKMKKCFLVWHCTAKEATYKLQRKWKMAIRKRRLQAIAICILNDHAQKQIRHKEIYYQINCQTKINKVTNSFLIWIEHFNQRSIDRKKMYHASKHWVQKTMSMNFKFWAYKIKERERYRHLVRHVTPMRCLLRMITQAQHVPQNIITAEVGQELYNSIQYYRMRKIDETKLYDSVSEFKFNLMYGVFSTLKKNYHDICTFKATKAINIASQVIYQWRVYAQRKRFRRNQVEAFNSNLVVNQYRQLLQQWHYYAAQQKQLAQNHILIQQASKFNMKQAVFEAMRTYFYEKGEKSLKKYKLRQLYEEQTKSESFRQLAQYVKYRQEKRAIKNKIHKNWRIKFLQKMIEGLLQATEFQKVLSANYKTISTKTEHSIVIGHMKEWHITAIQFSHARKYHNFHLKKSQFQLLREAMLLSQISHHKKIKAQRFKENNLKYNLLWFLKEYIYEQELKKSRHASLTRQVQQLKKANIFHGILIAIENTQKKNFLKLTLDANYKRKLKADVFQRFFDNISQERRIQEFTYCNEMNFKKEMFDYLRYSIRKQQLLRYALIETVEKRAKHRVDLVLKTWKTKTMEKMTIEESIDLRIMQFVKVRTLRKFRFYAQFRHQQEEIHMMGVQYQNVNLMKKFFLAWQAYHHSPRVINKNKAEIYRRKQLFAPSFVALKRLSFLRKMHSELREISDHRVKSKLLLRWVNAVSVNKLNTKTIAYQQKNSIKQTFKALRTYYINKKESKLQNNLAHEHNMFRVAASALRKLKFFTLNKSDVLAHKQNVEFRMQVQYLKSKFILWSKRAQKTSKLSQQAKKATQIKNSLMKKQYFRQMTAKYTGSLKDKKANDQKGKMIKLRVWRYLKKEALKNRTLMNLLNKWKGEKDKKLCKLFIEGLHQSKKLKREARNKKKWGMVTQPEEISSTPAEVFTAVEEMPFSSKFKKPKHAEAVSSACPRAKKQENMELGALCHSAKFTAKKVFQILQFRRLHKQRRAAQYQISKQKMIQSMQSRVFREMVSVCIIEPQLDLIGDQHFIRRQLQTFKVKVNYIRDRRNGQALHDFEIKAYQTLGRKLLRKAFSGIKLIAQANMLKNQEKEMILHYQQRKWFGQWRCNYLIKSQNHYLNQPVAASSSSFLPAPASRSNSRQRAQMKENVQYNNFQQPATQSFSGLGSPSNNKPTVLPSYMYSTQQQTRSKRYQYRKPPQDPRQDTAQKVTVVSNLPEEEQETQNNLDSHPNSQQKFLELPSSEPNQRWVHSSQISEKRFAEDQEETDLRRKLGNAPLSANQANGGDTGVTSPPPVMSNMTSAVKIGTNPRTPTDSISIQQKVQQLSEKINSRLAASRSRSNSENPNLRVVSENKPQTGVQITLVNQRDELQLPEESQQPSITRSPARGKGQARQRNLQQSSSPKKRKNKDDEDSFNKKAAPIEPYSKEHEDGATYHPISAPLTRTRTPNEGGSNSFKSFLKQKQGQFQSDSKEPAPRDMLNQNSGSKTSSGDKKSLILSMHSVDEEVLPDQIYN